SVCITVLALSLSLPLPHPPSSLRVAPLYIIHYRSSTIIRHCIDIRWGTCMRMRCCNFNTLSRKFDKSLSSPTTFSLPLHQGRKFCPADTVQTLAEFSSVVNIENGYTRHGY